MSDAVLLSVRRHRSPNERFFFFYFSSLVWIAAVACCSSCRIYCTQRTYRRQRKHSFPIALCFFRMYFIQLRVCVCVEACVLYVSSVVHAAYSAPFLHAHIFFCVCVAFVLGCIIGRLCISSISDHLLFNFFPLSFSFLCAISFVRLLSCDCLAYIL